MAFTESGNEQNVFVKKSPGAAAGGLFEHIRGRWQSLEKGIDTLADEYLLKGNQFFAMQGWYICISIVLPKLLIFVLAELVEWQQLDTAGAHVFELLYETCGIAELIIVAGDHGNARQHVFAAGYRQTHVG